MIIDIKILQREQEVDIPNTSSKWRKMYIDWKKTIYWFCEQYQVANLFLLVYYNALKNSLNNCEIGNVLLVHKNLKSTYFTCFSLFMERSISLRTHHWAFHCWRIVISRNSHFKLFQKFAPNFFKGVTWFLQELDFLTSLNDRFYENSTV